ncbi:hypothetical protein [Variovorax sp. JS1663]|uniref:hypothetical protein n=1 Tax=Variovorax sp. JS1663 TaxID=1851577 RepID=UPI00117FC291|nr:hypothetical protein [Variovorax sp. JS1663]
MNPVSIDTMKTRTILHRRLAPMLALSAIAGAAHAQIPVTDGILIATVQQSTQQITQTIQNGFRDQTETLSDKIADLKRGLANAISGAAETTSKASSGAAKVVAESAQRTASEQATIRDEQRFSGIDPCNVLVSTIGTSEASRGGVTATGGGSGGGGPKPAPGGSAGMNDVLDVAEKRKAAGLPEVEAAKAAKAACSTFAVNGGLRGSACTDSGFSASNSAGYPDADIRASTLFDGPQTDADGTKFTRRLTVDMSGAEGTALRALMRNLDQPVQLQDLTKAQRATDAGRQFMALENAFAARMSVAKYPQEAQANLLAAKPELIEMVKQMLKSEDGPYVQKYLDKNAPNWSSKGISMAELIALETQRRYMNPDWQLRLLTMSDTDIARENVRMQAMNAWLQSLALDRQIVASVIESNAAQAAIRSEMMPQLVAANKRAVSR